MEQRHHRSRIGELNVGRVRGAQDDDELIPASGQTLQGRTIDRIAPLEGNLHAPRLGGRSLGLHLLGLHGRDDEHLRIGGHVVAQLLQDHRAAAVPAQDQEALERRRGREFVANGRWVNVVVRRGRRMERRAAGRDGDHLVAGLDRGLHRRVDLDPPIRVPESDQCRIRKAEQRLAVGDPDQARRLVKVDGRALETEQLRVDHRQTRLAAGLGDEARNQAVHQEDLGFIAADQAGESEGWSACGARPRCDSDGRGGPGLWPAPSASWPPAGRGTGLPAKGP